jgi:glycerol uptake facilitator-like aquaporin
MTPGRRAAAEALATALLLATIIGSGVMGENLAQSNVAIALLANTIATGAILVVLILAFGPISGAHMNPLVSVAEAWRGNLAWREVPLYVGAQIAGAYAGVAAAHAMFGKPLFFASQHVRAGWPVLWSEVVAAFGLLLIVLNISRTRPEAVPYAVGAYITAAYWFTASTSFANPAVTLARAASDTFAGIRPDDVTGFIFGQIAGMVLAMLFYRWIYKDGARATRSPDV